MEWRARVHESERVQVYRAQRNMNSCSSHAALQSCSRRQILGAVHGFLAPACSCSVTALLFPP